MRTYTIRFRLSGADAGIERYCPGCGRVVTFRDSGKTRRNANGKTVHSFAIYKCPRDHTWNRRLDAVPAGQCEAPVTSFDCMEERIRLDDLWSRGFDRIELQLEIAGGGFRLDKALCAAFPGLSRGEAQRLIRAGCVLLAGVPARQGLILRRSASLSVLPEA